MVRFGVTNIYLMAGLGLLALGLALGAWLSSQSAPAAHRDTLSWIAYGSFASGIVLYVIGRLALVMQRRSKA